MKKVSVVVPCYNEEQNVKLFFEEIKKVVDENNKYKFEIIFINDHSKDNTLEELKKLLNSKIEVKIIDFSRNFGKEAAMYAGLENASGDYVSIIDADLQQDPCLISKMLDNLAGDKYDSVCFYQEERHEGCILGGFKDLFYKLINKTSKIDFRKSASDFRMFKRNVVDEILKLKESNRFSKGIFSYVGFNTLYLPYQAKVREYGKTSWSFNKLLKYAIDGIIGYSNLLISIPYVFGIISIIIGFIYLFIKILLLVFNVSTLTSLSIILIILFIMFGIVLLMFGIVLSYLSRMLEELKNRPVYIIKRIYKN